jgi:hypothetical protein
MTTYEFDTTIEKGIIKVPENILKNLSPQVEVVIYNKKAENIPSEIMLASEKSLSNDWLLPEEDLAWQNL